jgi:hypothetical protein
MVQMLQSQSNLMKELESKLAGATAISFETWEKMTEQQREEAEIQRQRRESRREQELAELRREIQENESLATVAQLIELAQGLGEARQADGLIMVYRKMGKNREMKNKAWDGRKTSDDWAVSKVLEEALYLAYSLASSFPDLQEELTTIREKINEQLAHFS